MPPLTPFFADFHHRLFGKAPLSGLQELLRHSPQVPSISHYQELFGKLVPQELLAGQKRGANSRQRFFSSSVTFWSFLGQVLEPGSSCRDALRRLNAWWQWRFPDRALPSHDTSAYCQARARLSESRLRRLCDHLGQQLEEQAGEDQLWLGRRVKIIDGTSVSMPDTAANQELWPQSSAQKPGCGFPLLKLLGVLRRGKRLGPNDRLVVWTKPPPSTSRWTKEQLKTLPDTIQLRLVRYRIETPGCRCQEVILVTTLVDAHRFSAAQLAELYFRRWGVELHFRQIKILLGMDMLRCLSPAMVRKELLMHLVSYNLIRALMQRASLIYHVPLGRLSFKGTLDSLHHFADAVHAAHAKPTRQLFDALLLTIAADQVPLRPNRSEPRVKKRRPKNYHLLTKPRHSMVLSQHRSRHRAKP